MFAWPNFSPKQSIIARSPTQAPSTVGSLLKFSRKVKIVESKLNGFDQAFAAKRERDLTLVSKKKIVKARRENKLFEWTFKQ